MAQTTAKTFLITGVSSGFGRALAQAALRDRHIVVGTVRKESDKADFEKLGQGAHAVILDVTDTAQIAPAVAAIEKNIGAIDVLVNNAGYGHEGILEESSIDDLRRQFDVNVFGAVAMIQAVLPAMRKRRAGHILNITSMGGIITLPGLSYYHGSKFALEGISETLGKEVKDLGIHVTAIEPGGFRTDWAGRSMVRAARLIADYDALIEPIRKRRIEASGWQIGDPAKAAQAMLKVAHSDNPPAHLLLGSDAVRLVGEKMKSLQADFDAWNSVSLSTDVTTNAYCNSTGAPPMSHDRSTIEALITHYFDGIYEGDTDKLSAIFHPSADLRGLEQGELQVRTVPDWLDQMRKRPSAKAEGKPREDFVVTIDRSDESTAFVKLRCQLPPRYFTDYLVAMKLGDGCRIVSKSYRYDLRE